MINSGSPLEVKEINCPLTLGTTKHSCLSSPVSNRMQCPTNLNALQDNFLNWYLMNCHLESQLSIDIFWIVTSNETDQ